MISMPVGRHRPRRNRRSVAEALWGKEALMTEERFAEIQQELEALEASLAPEEMAVGSPHPFILILLMLDTGAHGSRPY
jgi:hypothetical protein